MTVILIFSAICAMVGAYRIGEAVAFLSMPEHWIADCLVRHETWVVYLAKP